MDALFLKSQTKKSLELESRKQPGEVMWSPIPRADGEPQRRSDVFTAAETSWQKQDKNAILFLAGELEPFRGDVDNYILPALSWL